MAYRNILFGSCAVLLAACGAQDKAPQPKATTAAITDAPTVNVPVFETKAAFFGDLHVHTRNSFDAFIFNTRATPDDAYKFAKGGAIDNGLGTSIQLSGPPLDFMAVTDHGEYLGIIPAMANPKSDLFKTATAQSIFGKDATHPRASFLRVGLSVVNGEEIEDIFDRGVMNSVWAETRAAADRHYKPGEFTTFAGYEFTSMTQVSQLAAANLHRNVIFKTDAPEQVFSTLDSTNPEDLWAWMNDLRASGTEVLSIPHNSNASNGQMFAIESYTGEALTRAYAENRMVNEPVIEITQVKGTSETHPILSPNDEWAGFEQYEYLIGSTDKSMPSGGSFARPALGRGIALEGELGANPYAFGFIGSSDTHLAAPSLNEEDHFGKFPADLDFSRRQSIPSNGAKDWSEQAAAEVDVIATPQYGASGLAGVWAKSNTREAIFESMQAKETFGTSGPRLKVRMFAGYGYAADILTRPDMLDRAYAGGVAMGRDLKAEATAPTLIAWAARDPDDAPLERLQIIKVTQDGEQVVDVACGDGSAPDAATQRCIMANAQVNTATCALPDGVGAGELKATWRDPDYNPKQAASYYVRALEIPKCRWSTWDAVRNGTPPNPDMAVTIQDRAWGSPIWVKP